MRSIFNYNPNLKKNKAGIWQLEDDGSIDYSDGDAQEAYLRSVLQDCEDVSLDSQELKTKIGDWTSEYHFSAQRANILRALNLKEMNDVLELGCGCGAVTRYLGECGLHVDAVEGSRNRAEIAKLRCGDLDTIEITAANFNDILIPENAYDAVLLIGVLEYAEKFYADCNSGQEAALKILKRAHSALKENGVLVIAIENRMGLKYWLGASEDHHGSAYEGLSGYHSGSGIRTYDKAEWEKILSKSDTKHYRFAYPFPDYKLPDVVLGENFIKEDPHAASLLYSVASRDYGKVWQTPVNEFLTWETLHQSGLIGEFSNSFLILAADNDACLNNIMPNDFICFSNPERKPLYRVTTFKPLGVDHVEKQGIEPDNIQKDGYIQQRLETQPYINGPLLSAKWSHALAKTDNLAAFERCIREYYDFILSFYKNNDNQSCPVDLMPSNIIIDASGDFIAFDQEWNSLQPIEPDYVLFRSLMWFFSANNVLCRTNPCLREIKTIQELIGIIFNRLNLPLENRMDKFVALEEKLQKQIHYQKNEKPIKELINRNIQDEIQDNTPELFNAQVFWAEELEEISEKYSVKCRGKIGTEHQKLSFDLPYLSESTRYLRIDPADRPGFFHLHRIVLAKKYSATGDRSVLLDLSDANAIAKMMKMSNVQFCSAAMGEVFLSTGDDPQILIDLCEIEGNRLKAGAIEILIEMDWPKSADYFVVKDTFLQKEVQYQQQIDQKKVDIEHKKNRINELTQKRKADKEKIDELGRKIEQQRHQIMVKDKKVETLKKERDTFETDLQNKDVHIQNISTELHTIKNSKVWRFAEFFRRTLYVRILGKLPLIQKSALTITNEGFRTFIERVKAYRTKNNFPASLAVEDKYEIWKMKHELSPEIIVEIQNKIKTFAHKPLFSIVMPVYNVDAAWLEKAIASVLNQIYTNWELCIADDASPKAHVRQVLKRYENQDNRIKVVYLSENQGIAGASNEAAALASGDFIGLLDHDDEISLDALYENANAVNQDPSIGFMYSDEDNIDTEGNRIDPFFKPDYSPDMLLSQNYICHFSVFRRSLFQEIGGFRAGFDGSQDHDLILRLTAKAKKVHHISRVLYHWRKISGSVADCFDSKSYAWEAGRRAVAGAIKREKVDGKVELGKYQGTYNAVREIRGNPLVSIIIPFRDKPDILKRCLDSIFEKSTYANFEILGISNNSSESTTFELMKRYSINERRIQFFEHNVPFNYSEINNYAASMAKGEHLLLLNNDIEIIAESWIEALLGHSQRPEVGAVGGLLLYPDDKIQHAGVIIGLGGVAGHSHKHSHRTLPGYFFRPHLTQNISAVTAACLMVKKDIFLSAKGLNEVELKVAFNDVDFCLRLVELGYLNVYTPYCKAYHHESLSRGYEDTHEKVDRFKNEINYIRSRHNDIILNGDPYYNPNLTPHSEDFSINI